MHFYRIAANPIRKESVNIKPQHFTKGMKLSEWNCGELFPCRVLCFIRIVLNEEVSLLHR